MNLLKKYIFNISIILGFAFILASNFQNCYLETIKMQNNGYFLVLLGMTCCIKENTDKKNM